MKFTPVAVLLAASLVVGCAADGPLPAGPAQASLRVLKGPNVKTLRAPAGWPGPSRTDIAHGTKRGDGTCDLQGSYPAVPGLYVLVTELDLDSCDAVVVQFDWAKRINAIPYAYTASGPPAAHETALAVPSCETITLASHRIVWHGVPNDIRSQYPFDTSDCVWQRESRVSPMITSLTARRQ